MLVFVFMALPQADWALAVRALKRAGFEFQLTLVSVNPISKGCAVWIPAHPELWHAPAPDASPSSPQQPGGSRKELPHPLPYQHSYCCTYTVAAAILSYCHPLYSMKNRDFSSYAKNLGGFVFRTCCKIWALMGLVFVFCMLNKYKELCIYREG